MIEELATVTAIQETTVTLTSQIKSSCSNCAQINTCGSGQIAKAIPQKALTLTVPYPKGLDRKLLTLGDSVILGLPEADVMASAGQVYLFPLSGLIFFSGFGQWLVNQEFLNHELWGLTVGLFGGYLGYRLARYRQTDSKQASKLQPALIRRFIAEHDTNRVKTQTE